MADEYSDILGAGTLPIGPKNTGFWSSLSLTSKLFLIFVLLLTSYVGVGRLLGVFWKWREREYKLSMRRKYGIPDNDHRPFNVAYAAAQLAREQEIKQRGKRRSAVQSPSQVSSREQRDGYSDSIRHRPTSQHNTSSAKFPGSLSEDKSHLVPRGTSPHLSGYSDNHHPYNNRVTFADGYNISASLDLHADLAPLSSSTRRVSDRKSLGILKSNNHNYSRPKRSLVEDDLEERFGSKKTRLESEDLIDGGEDDELQSHGHASSQYARVSKRGFEEGDTEEKDKRQRKVSVDKMDVDDDLDVVGELVGVSPSRGRKRDRAEAGSTFEGDDDDENIALDEDYSNRSRYRKRRNKRTSDAYSGRSRKRDRDLNDTGDYSDSNEDSAASARSIRSKKKGKKQQRGEDEKGSDVSMDDSQSVRSTLKGRKIGEEWTSNGVKYKISPNGQRLRETLLKKAKQRFIMPEDSMHPDRNAFHDVYVEAWLTDEEYQNFAAQGAIYEPPKEPEAPSSNNSPVSQRSAPLVSKGKHLLWESTIPHPPTPLANPFESRKALDGASNALVPRSLGLQVAFPKSGRIASAFRGSVNADATSGPPSPSLVDSTNNLSSPRAGKYKQYSKWEKQDMEAQAMIRMREATNKKKEEDRIAHEKKEQEARAKAATTSTPTVPTISFTKPPEDQVKEVASKSPFSLSSTANVSGTSATPDTAPKLTLGTPTPTGSNLTSLAPDNKPKAPSPLSFSFAPTSSNVTSSSTGAASAAPSGFSFAQPPPALSGKPQEATFAATKPAPPSGSFAQPPSLSSKSQEGLGLGFPSSSTPSQSQPAPITLPPTTSAPITTNVAAAPTTAPKFNFGLPAKPAAEPSKEIGPNVSGSSNNPLLARLSPAGDSTSKPQTTPSQGIPTAADPSTSATTFFSFTKPASSLAVSSSSSNPPTTLGQKPTESQTQQAPPSSSSSGAPAPLKFSFGAFKTPAPNTVSTPAAANTTPGHAGSTESKPVTQNVFTLSKSHDSSGTSATAGPPKFNFGAAAASSTSGAAVTNMGTKSSFGFGNTPSTGTTAGLSSPFGSVFGAHATPAAEIKDQPKPSSAFGTGATGPLFGNSGSSSTFGSGSVGMSGTFGYGSSSLNPLGSKAEITSTSKPDTAASLSAFGSTGFGAFGSKSQDSASGAAAPKSGFVGFGTTPTSVANGPSSTAPATTSLFGSGGASSAPESNVFGTSKPAQSKSSFETSGAPAPADKSDTTPKPTTISFGGSTTPAGTPAAATKSSFLFGAPSGTSSSGTSNGAFSFTTGATSTTPASSPFGGATGSTALGAFGANNTMNTMIPNPFNFGATPSTPQQPK